jgi:AcrR family transcriptional regulator
VSTSYDDVRRYIDSFLGPHDEDDRKARKRLQIVEAAKELFVKHGYRKTNVDEIAKRAGVAKGTVYLNFKTKLDLLLGSIVLEKKAYLERMEPILWGGLPPAHRLRGWLRAAFLASAEMPLLSKLMSGDRELLAVLAELPPDVVERMRSFSTEFLGELIDGAARPHRWTRSELDDRAAVLMGLAHFGMLLTSDEVRGGLSHERFAELLAEIVTDGLVASPAGGFPSNDEGHEP